HFQGTIAVADPGPEEESGQLVVTPGEEAALPRVLAADAVADCQRGVVGEGEQEVQVGQVKLAIRIGEGNPVKTGRLEPGAQGGAIPAVFGVPQQAYVWARLSRLLDLRGGIVLAAVVHDQDFVTAAETRQGIIGLGDRLSDAAG